MFVRRRPVSVARAAFLACSVLAMGGCDLLGQADIVRNLRKEPSGPAIAAPLTEQGLGKLAKGELIAAMGLFDQALKANPADVYALMGRGIIHQRWNEPTQARQAYQAVVALHPDDTVRMVVDAAAEPQSVMALASANLVALGGDAPPASAAGGVTQQITGMPPSSSAMRPGPGSARAAATQPFLNDADANTIARFETLAKLRDQGLITPDEYAERRKANIGALLPMTYPAPASVGLDRPVPPADQIVSRLNSINRALEMRAINMAQHSAERMTIIDGLLPATPRATLNPPLPPKDLMQAADTVRKLEAMKERGVISDDEFKKEKDALDRVMTPPAPPPPAAGTAPNGTAYPQTPVSTGSLTGGAGGGPRPAVHIASYRSEADANKGWTQLRRAYQQQLGNLQPQVARVNLGAQKGIFYRLMAGPLSQADADRVCRELKAKRQYCETTFMSMDSAKPAVAAPPGPASAPAPAAAPLQPPPVAPAPAPTGDVPAGNG